MQEFLKINQSKLESALYVVATPIGNLKDITIRALETLQNANFIICEDTRVTARLLEKYGISDKKVMIYNDHSAEKDRLKILNLIIGGSSIALVSDAGTPLVSDPGYKLVELIKNNNQKVIPIPGASSIITLLSASGIAPDNFLFLGFLPNTKIARTKILSSLSKNYNFIFFESPNRLIDSLLDIKEVLGNRKISVGRELTKMYEEILTDKIENIITYFQTNDHKQRGELVIAVEKADKNEEELSEEELALEIKAYLKKGLSIKDLSDQISGIYNLNRKKIYRVALEISNNLK